MRVIGRRVLAPREAQPGSAIIAAIASVKGRSQAANATKVASAAQKAPNRLTQAEAQAILDRARAAAQTPERLILTVKEFGVLRKRLTDYDVPVAQLEDITRHTLTFWATYSQQNAKAARRSPGQDPLPAAPSASAFVYRFPYFLKAYRNYKAGLTVSKTVEADDRNLKTIDFLRNEVSRLTKALRQRAAPVPAPAAPAVKAPTRVIESGLPKWRDL